MTDDLSRQLRDYLTAAERRERAAADHTKATAEGLRLIAKSIDEGFRVLADTMRDLRR